MDEKLSFDDFNAYCQLKNITLTRNQESLAKHIFTHDVSSFRLCGTGLSFLFSLVEEYIKSQPVDQTHIARHLLENPNISEAYKQKLLSLDKQAKINLEQNTQ